MRVSLTGGAPNLAFVRFVATLPERSRSDPDTLLVLLRLLRRRTVTASALVGLLQKDVTAVAEVLTRCDTDLGLLERTRESARSTHGTYRLRAKPLADLGTAVAYRAKTGRDTDEKVIALVPETGRLNSRMQRTLLDVDTPTASRILADLVVRGVISRDSVATRGPGVTYAPGAAFPSSTPARRRARRAPARRASQSPSGAVLGSDGPG